MKKHNNMWKRLLAVGMAFALMLQCFSGISFVSQAMEIRDDYTELTYSDLSGSKFAGVNQTNLDGCAFNAKITFTDGGYFRIGGLDSAGGWVSTLQVRMYADLNS